MTVSDAWEQHAQSWIGWASESTFDGFFSGTWPTLQEILPEARGVTIDLGCGEGRAGRQLFALGHDVVGVDLSPTLLRAARDQAPVFPVLRGDMTRLPFATGCTSLVVASCSLHDVDDLQGAIVEVARILQPGGMLCAAIVHPFSSAEDVASVHSDDYLISEPYLEPRRYVLEDSRGGQSMTFVSMHWPLSAYVNGLAAADLRIDQMREVGDRNIPWLMVLRAVKLG